MPDIRMIPVDLIDPLTALGRAAGIVLAVLLTPTLAGVLTRWGR